MEHTLAGELVSAEDCELVVDGELGLKSTRVARYVISAISPSKMDPLTGFGKTYEILCKTFRGEAKAQLEV
ncbi:hypothetical protein KSP40_PGU021450 [Platanthera guangdongensis]|uniref:Uncharacterized protein n=1 Tax=Platanthera guangdongensis TaxID=2320717 RepID=A0ABR2MU20_9ASPA